VPGGIKRRAEKERRAMTAINGVGQAAPLGSAGRPAARRGGFSVDGAEAGSAAAATGAPADISLAGLLALQSDEADELRDRPARQRGQALLNALAALQRAMLAEAGGGREQLEALAGLADSVPDAADPRLRAAMDAIMLRVQVELARHDLA
jgi:hypothetical protein